MNGQRTILNLLPFLALACLLTSLSRIHQRPVRLPDLLPSPAAVVSALAWHAQELGRNEANEAWTMVP